MVSEKICYAKLGDMYSVLQNFSMTQIFAACDCIDVCFFSFLFYCYRRKNSQLKNDDFTVDDLCQLSKFYFQNFWHFSELTFITISDSVIILTTVVMQQIHKPLC